MNRILAISIVGLWLTAITSLFLRDVLPFWRAQDPPRGQAPAGDTQVSILDARDHRIGTSWVTIRRNEDQTTWQSTTQLSLDGLAIPGVLSLPTVLFDSTLEFQKDGTLLTFETTVSGMPERIEIKGCRLGIDYSCIARFGAGQQQFTLDARLCAGVGDMLRPFTHLNNLYVGQSWQVRLLDPFSLLRQSPEFTPVRVEVAGIDMIPHRGNEIECFRVESDRGSTVAWVDRTGRVILQRVLLPWVGKISLVDEPFEEDARRRARAGIRDRADKRSPAARREKRQPEVAPADR